MKKTDQKEKKAFSEELALRMKSRRDFSRKEMKRAFSPESTKEVIKLCRKVIKDKQAREQTIAFIRAVDGKKIRNTSGV